MARELEKQKEEQWIDSPLPDAKFDEQIDPAKLLKDESPAKVSTTEQRVSTAD